jgi:dimethylargininase
VKSSKTDRFNHAIVRTPSATLSWGLTTVVGATPDVERALSQHRAYVEALARMGLEIVQLEPLPRFPDAYFVEDTAVVDEEFAVVTRPGAGERRGEEARIEPVLARFRDIERIEAPGTVDGGDVLEIGGHYFIGVSDRTNEEGAAQLGRILSKRGRAWSALAVGTGLHLKSSVNALDEETLLVTAEYADRQELGGWDRVVVAPGEEYAANSLAINGKLLVPEGYPKTEDRLRGKGYFIETLDVSEIRLMDGGLSCMSLRFSHRGERA